MGNEMLGLVKAASEGGTVIVVLVIWLVTIYYMAKKDKAQSDRLDDAFRLHGDLTNKVIELLENEQEYKTMLAGIFSRIEEKLSKPVACPIIKGDDHVDR